MCFNDDGYSSYESRVEIRNGQRYCTEVYYPRFGMTRRRRCGFGGPYYPSRYCSCPPTGCHDSGAFVYPNRYSQFRSGYPRSAGPRGYSQAVVPRGFVGGYPGYSSGYAYGTRYHVGTDNVMPVNSAMRTYYNTIPSYGYIAHVYSPGQTTTATTYYVTNGQAQAYSSPAAHIVRETRPAYAHGHVSHGPTRQDIHLENRRVATERGAYDPRKIRPADARDDDPFWCREINGEWHLRSYYQIENECHPGRWMMDAEVGFLVFHRA